MSTRPDRDALTETVLHHVRDAAGDTQPPVARDYALADSGAVVDLAVAAEEFIGFVIHRAGDPLDALQERLAQCARYCERVVVAVPAADTAELADIERSGAAVWAIEPDGALVERIPGRANRVAPAALFALMTPGQRAALLRPAIRVGPYDRTRPPVSPEQVRAQFGSSFGAPR